jgi:flagellar biosynthesis/type III secretory pathway protein FliH
MSDSVDKRAVEKRAVALVLRRLIREIEDGAEHIGDALRYLRMELKTTETIDREIESIRQEGYEAGLRAASKALEALAVEESIKAIEASMKPRP